MIIDNVFIQPKNDEDKLYVYESGLRDILRIRDVLKSSSHYTPLIEEGVNNIIYDYSYQILDLCKQCEDLDSILEENPDFRPSLERVMSLVSDNREEFESLCERLCI